MNNNCLGCTNSYTKYNEVFYYIEVYSCNCPDIAYMNSQFQNTLVMKTLHCLFLSSISVTYTIEYS